MNRWEYLALALELWTALGLLGLLLSLARRERRKLHQGVFSLAGVWAIYLAALLTLAHRQPERRIPMGQPACFHALCFTVMRVEEPSGFPPRNHDRLLRLAVYMTNRGSAPASDDLQPSLHDAQGRTWKESTGVSGNQLSARVLPGGTIVSQPVFALAPDANGLALILSHGRWSRRTLVLGDPESFGHRPQVMLLDR